MPLSFRYDPYRDLLINIGDGPVTLEDIADLKAHESGLPSDEYAGMRQAEIVTDPKTTAVLLIWRNWLPKDVLVEVFSTAAAAYEWLGVERRPGDLDP